MKTSQIQITFKQNAMKTLNYKSFSYLSLPVFLKHYRKFFLKKTYDNVRVCLKTHNYNKNKDFIQIDIIFNHNILHILKN